MEKKALKENEIRTRYNTPAIVRAGWGTEEGGQVRVAETDTLFALWNDTKHQLPGAAALCREPGASSGAHATSADEGNSAA